MKISLVTKSYPIYVEVIDGQLLAFRHAANEIIPLEIELEGHNNFFVFNVIKIPTSLVILRLSWFKNITPI